MNKLKTHTLTILKLLNLYLFVVLWFIEINYLNFE